MIPREPRVEMGEDAVAGSPASLFPSLVLLSPLSPDPAPVLEDRAGSFAGLALLPLVYPHMDTWLQKVPRGTKAEWRSGGGGCCLLRIDGMEIPLCSL